MFRYILCDIIRLEAQCSTSPPIQRNNTRDYRMFPRCFSLPNIKKIYRMKWWFCLWWLSHNVQFHLTFIISLSLVLAPLFAWRVKFQNERKLFLTQFFTIKKSSHLLLLFYLISSTRNCKMFQTSHAWEKWPLVRKLGCISEVFLVMTIRFSVSIL